jgi:hypothetical protein
MGEFTVTEPGVYEMPAEEYHADPVPGGSLSSSGTKKLLPPSCPALYKYGRSPTRAMEFGTASHTVVLGAGAGLARIEADSWRKNETKQAGDEARAAGLTPVLAEQHDRILAMAEAIKRHRAASLLFAPGSGLPEQSIFWHDPDLTINGAPLWRRARLDWLPWGSGQTLIVPDYKTSGHADPESVARQIDRMGYHQSGAWYRDAALAARPLATEVRFVLVVQETTPPYLVACYNIHPRALAKGTRKNRRAMEIYRDCTESGIWPGHNPYEDIQTIDLPRWADRDDDEWDW